MNLSVIIIALNSKCARIIFVLFLPQSLKDLIQHLKGKLLDETHMYMLGAVRSSLIC